MSVTKLHIREQKEDKNASAGNRTRGRIPIDGVIGCALSPDELDENDDRE
jgi:hypothetical protein